MYRTALRSTPQIANAFRQPTFTTSGRRFASTSPAHKKRSWKSLAARWGLATGAVYWYSTSAAFAEEPLPKTIPPPPQFSDEDLPTVEAVVAQKRREAEARLQNAPLAPEPATATLPLETSSSAPAKDVETPTRASAPGGSAEALEEEADQQGAFNPETGEINWDCPCLGGMAHGPCGEEFKAAFSCFVYSNEEPKGMDCIDKFQHMQDCFRQHPEVYGDELDENEAAEAATEAEKTTPPQDDIASKSSSTTTPAGEAKKTDAEAEDVAKATEKQNTPPSQP